MTTTDAQGSRSFPRALLALVILAAGAVLALRSASGVAYWEPQGAGRVREVAPALAASVCIGLVSAAAALAILRRRVLSPWLAIGGLPAAALSLNHMGVIG